MMRPSLSIPTAPCGRKCGVVVQCDGGGEVASGGVGGVIVNTIVTTAGSAVRCGRQLGFQRRHCIL